MDKKIGRMHELVAKLEAAGKAYYADAEEIMSNFTYDELYDELVHLEEELNITLPNSPTNKVGFEAVDFLPKEKHEKPMLSLGKTKERQDIKVWLQDQEGLLSWKMDGLTIVLTYRDGLLYKAVTRGNGEVGEVITNNAKTFINLPRIISYKGELILRGEAVISYPNFNILNDEIENANEKYKNPRNLCAGSVRQLNSEITAKRKVQFFAFTLVQAEGVDFKNSRKNQLLFLKEQGFSVIDFVSVNKTNVIAEIEEFERKIKIYPLPSDGLVVTFDDISYGTSLGRTAKFPRDAIAFKWVDEIAYTKLLYIEWSASRTGRINPVAVFETVELEGTSVQRASVHNISVMEGLQLGEGDEIAVYKANMIIPQIAENRTKSNSIHIPTNCPVCGGKTLIREVGDGKALYCLNPNCPAKKIKSFALFTSRNALNIDGLSEATLEKLIAKGLIHSLSDIFVLKEKKEEILLLEGFKEKSTENLLQAIENARHTSVAKLIYGLGIANIGVSNAKVLANKFKNDFTLMEQASIEDLSLVDGIGEIIATSFFDYLHSKENRILINKLQEQLFFEPYEETKQNSELIGKVIVITGSLQIYGDRSALKETIEDNGGKVTATVTKKTDILINNDAFSTSSKNTTAKEFGIPILTEEKFIEMYL